MVRHVYNALVQVVIGVLLMSSLLYFENAPRIMAGGTKEYDISGGFGLRNGELE